MKILHYILLGTAALLLSVSCAKENPVPVDEQEVVITVSTGTRAVGDADGTPNDHYINSLRVLGYRTSDGTLAFNEKVYGFPTSTVNATVLNNQQVDVKTGRFTIVFIANEHSEVDANSDGTNDMSALLNGITTSNNNTLSYLKDNAKFSYHSFYYGYNIPMAVIKENIIIQEENKLIDPELGSAPITTVWPVMLTRLGIRVDVTLKLTDAQVADWRTVPTLNKEALSFYNIPEWVSVFPNIYHTGSTTSRVETFVDMDTYPDEGDLKVFKARFILPEYADPNLEATTGLILGLPQGATVGLTTPEKKGAVSNMETDGLTPKGWAGKYGYTIPRNHYLGVTATIKESDTEITFNINVLSWDEANLGDKELQ